MYGKSDDVTCNNNIFYNLWSGTPGAAIRFDAGIIDKDLYVRDCLFIYCGSNGGDGGVIWFDADDVTIERDAVFDCEAIKSNNYASGTFVYLNIDDDSKINQVIVVRTCPESSRVHYSNELSGAKYYSVFYIYVDPGNFYSYSKVNQTECHGTYYSPCFEGKDGNSDCQMSQSIFVRCICNNAYGRGLVYVYDTHNSLYFKINNIYFVDCQSNPSSVNYGCISTKSAGVSGSNNVYFIRCTMKALINKEEGGYSFSNYYKYSCTISQDTIGSPGGTIINGGNDAPKEQMAGLVATKQFDILGKVYNPTYSGFCPDMDISFTFLFSPSSQFNETSKFPESSKLTLSSHFSLSQQFQSSFHFNNTQFFSQSFVPLFTKSLVFTPLFSESSQIENLKIKFSMDNFENIMKFCELLFCFP